LLFSSTRTKKQKETNLREFLETRGELRERISAELGSQYSGILVSPARAII